LWTSGRKWYLNRDNMEGDLRSVKQKIKQKIKEERPPKPLG
jgi:hypothetical protein